MVDDKDENEISAELAAALDKRDDLYERSTSVAKELGSDYQADSLLGQDPLKMNFQDKADPTYMAQLEDMGKNDLERAEETTDGSAGKGESNPYNMQPPKDWETGQNSMDQSTSDGTDPLIEAQLDRREEDYSDGSEFDNEHQHASDYSDEYEP
ncbi:MAG: hypothetical protein AAF636_08495 [Pseudomonadota bacterium]